MPVAADLGVLMDELRLRDDGDTCLNSADRLVEAAQLKGLVETRDFERVGRWMGELVRDSLATCTPYAGQAPVHRGPWGSREFQQHVAFRLTAEGLRDARETRHRRKELAVDEDLAGLIGATTLDRLTPERRNAVALPASRLREALVLDRYGDALDAARAVVEAAAKVRLGSTAPTNETLLGLFRSAARIRPDGTSGYGSRTATQGLVTAVQGIAELRNLSGTASHSPVGESPATEADARVAAYAALAAVTFLLQDSDHQPKEQMNA